MIKNRDHKNNQREKVIKQNLQKQYVKPQLKEYGHIEKLTQTGGGTKIEGFQPNRNV